MSPSNIIALGKSLYGESWLTPMAGALEYSESQLWRVAYDGAPVTRRMVRRLEKLARHRARRLTVRRK